MVLDPDHRDQVDLPDHRVDLTDALQGRDFLGDLGDAGDVGVHEDDGCDHGHHGSGSRGGSAGRLMYGGDAPTVVKGGQFLAGLVDGVVNGQVTTGSTDRAGPFAFDVDEPDARSEEHTSELQALMRISYAVLFLKKKS